MRHLVLGGSGTVGRLVVDGLLKLGESVRVLTRSPEKARALPRGATAVVGDLADPDTYDRVFTDYDHLFLLNATTPSELQEGLAAVNEARRSGAKRVVYLSIHDVEKGPAVPHFATKIGIEHALAETGLPHTNLRPNNFYQNDLWFKDVILPYGVYPQPLGNIGLSRVDTRDIAEAAVRALTENGHQGKTYALAGPDALTGEDCAAEYSRALGKKVTYGGDDLVGWAKASRAAMPGWAVYDYALMYAMFQEKGLQASPAQREETRTIVGHEPRKYSDFVKETVAGWK